MVREAGVVVGSLFGEVIGNGYTGPTPPMDSQTDTTKSIAFPQLRWQAVKMTEY